MAKNIVTRKATQWGQLRKIHGYKNCEIAETLGHDQALVSGWFTGRLMPNDDNIKELCELFGEDFERGKQMFLDDYQPSGKRKSIEPKQAYYIPTISNPDYIPTTSDMPKELGLPFVVEDSEPKQFNDCIELAAFLHDKVSMDIIMIMMKSMDTAMARFNKDPISALEWAMTDLLTNPSSCKPREKIHVFHILATNGYIFYQEDGSNEK